MTDALYLEDSTETAVGSTVERVAEDRVVLDRTHAHATGGGQPHDTGVLRVDGDDDVAWYTLDRDTAKPNSTPSARARTSWRSP